MSDTRDRLESLLRERILVLDGAWGTMLQGAGLTAADYRGERFLDHPREVAGDPDLLNLTRPDLVLGRASSLSRGGRRPHDHEHLHCDEHRPGRLRPRRSRARAQPRRGAFGARGGRRLCAKNTNSALRRRLDRAAQRDALALPEGRRSLLSTRLVRRGARGLRRADRRSRRGRGRPAPRRDRLRHAERQGGDRGRAGGGARAAALDLGHDRRSQRPHALRTDCRGLLDVDRAREAAPRRGELLARRQGDEAARRRALAARRHLHEQPSERRPAERLRWLRRAATRDGDAAARVRRGRARQRRRWLLRHRAGARRADRRGGRRAAAARACAQRTQAAGALQRPRAVRARAGHRLRDDRRAHEPDRLGAVPGADRSGRLSRRRRRRARAGARRRELPRRQHGRRSARRRARDDDVPQPDRDRAGGRSDPDHDRQLALERPRGRPQVRPGEGGRQLDQPEGGRGDVPRAGPARARLRRRGRRDGLRRAGPGGDGRAKGVDLRSRVRPAHAGRRLRAGGSRLRSERARGRDRDRGAQRFRESIHRGATADQGALPGCSHERRDLEPLVLVSRQRRRARGDALGLPPARDPRGSRHGDRQRGSARRLRGHPGRPPRARRGRDLRPPPGRHRPARLLRRVGQGRGNASRARSLLARRSGRAATLARARTRNRRLHRGGHRGGAGGRASGRST